MVAHTASVVVVNSRHSASLVETLGVTPVVVSPGVDLAAFKPASQAEARRVIGLPLESRIALFVGRISEEKGADVFGEALSSSHGWLGVMAGIGALQSVIATRFPGILLRGPLLPDDVAMWLQSADVVVVPSRAEGLGLVAIEALACGIPVIASAVGGLVETVQHERTGILVAPGDPRALADALARLADDHLREMNASSAPASVAHHGIDRATDEMAAVWASVGVRL
jgi:glycosyltransferase involved in cell wall biosynthesis